MKAYWPTDPRRRAALYALAVAAALALASPFTPTLPFPLFGSGPSFSVTTAADAGPGSLRAAILDADRAGSRARIVVAVPRIAVASPLPPLVNPRGIAVESRSGAEIDGAGAEGVVLDIAAPGSVISNLRIVGAGTGIVVRAAGTSLQHVTVARGDIGVLVGEDAADVRIEQSSFIANRIGLQVVAHDGVITVQGVRFEKNSAAGIWAVSERRAPAPQLAVLGSHFRDDGHGIVVGGLVADVTGNSFEAFDSDAIHAAGARIRVKGNRIRAALGFGVVLSGTEGGRIEQNEISNNCAGGIMLRDATNAQVERNDTYQNGHGIVVMAGSASAPASIVDNLVADNWADGLSLVGASATVMANRVLRNHQIGLHVSAIGDERSRRSRPGRLLLQQNIVSGNGQEEHHDVLVLQSDPGAAASAPGDCRWRHTTAGQLADGRRSQ